MKKTKLINYARMANFAYSFGITSVIALLLGFWGGSWLDKKFATSPIFMLLGLLLGMVVTFQALFSELRVYNQLEELSSSDEEDDKGNNK